MGNQNPKEPIKPLDEVEQPATQLPELSSVDMTDHATFAAVNHGAPSFSMLANATQFGAFTFPELPTLDLTTALPSISAPDLSKPLTLPSVTLPTIQSVLNS